MKDLPVAALLAPLLLIQAKWARRNTPVLPEPVGHRSGENGTGEKLALLVLGDSAAAGVGVGEQRQALTGQLVSLLSNQRHLEWSLVAKTGATTADVLAWIPTIRRKQYDVIVISLGVNDVTSGVTRKRWLRQQQILVQELTSRFSTSKIIVTQVPPMGNFDALPQPLRWCLGLQTRRFNRIAKLNWQYHSVCDFMEFPFDFDSSLMASDRFHPGAKAYRLWAETLVKDLLSNT